MWVVQDSKINARLLHRRTALAALASVLLCLAGARTDVRAQTGTWSTEPSLPVAIQEVSVTALGGKVYVVGGSTSQARSTVTYVYDPVTRAWTKRASYPGTGRDHIGIAGTGGYVYIFGGVTAWPAPSVTTAQRYNPANNTWADIAPLPAPRAAMGVAVINGKIYLAGGLRDGAAVTDFTVYDPATNSYTTLAPMPTARDHLVAAAVNGKFYAIGGRDGSNATCAPLTKVEVYDPATNTWGTAASMNAPRGGLAAGTLNGRIQVFGGEGGAFCGVIGSAEEYNPATNTWTYLPKMITPRHGTGGAVIGDSVYLPGGALVTGDAPTAAHERFYEPPDSSSVPAPWVAQDVGGPAAAGGATLSGGTFTVKGSGFDIWGQTDAFHFVYQPLVGDGQITARVASLQNTHPNAKAGVMIRETLTGDSRHATMNVTPGAGLEFLRRANNAGLTTYTPGGGAAAPYWVRLARAGNLFSAYVSADGVNWTFVGSETITMGGNAYVGLAVTSHADGTLTTATIDNVSVTTSPPPSPAPSVTLSDDFNDNVRDTNKWYLGTLSDGNAATDPHITPYETNQRLEISPLAGVNGDHYNGYVTLDAFDFTGGRATAELVQATNTADFSDTTFALAADSSNWYRFAVENGFIRFDDKAAGTRNTSSRVPYDPARHRFLRFRHDAANDTVNWETSADGQVWVIQRTIRRNISVALVRAELNAGTYQAEAAPGTAVFDNFTLSARGKAANRPPVANAGQQAAANVNQSISFSAANSFDPDGYVADYRWDFGDGTTATGPSPAHAYAQTGIFYPSLTVTDDKGATNTDFTTVVIRAAAASTDPAAVGQWSPLIQWPAVTVHMSVLPDARILAWAHDAGTRPVPYLWDPSANNGVFTPAPVPDNPDGTQRDSLYCSGFSFLPDGRLLVAGGHLEPHPDDVHGSKYINIFDYRTNAWTRGPDMNAGRWYPTTTPLADGGNLIISGSIDDVGPEQDEGYIYRVNQLPQVYQPNGQLRSLTGAQLELPLYPWMFVARDGRVFNAGPNKTTRYLDTAGTGAWTTVGDSNYGFRENGTAVMYDDGKVLIAGGDDRSPTATAEVIDLNQPAPSWRYTTPMAHRRNEGNATILPDGKVLMTGGTMSGGFSTALGAVYAAEVWDPATEGWTTLASMSVPRLHHNVAVLLPDGRVVVGGGGQPTGTGDQDHHDVQIYSPPYLFKGARPTITSAPASVTYGQQFAVQTPDAASISQVTLVRLSASTHIFNQNQRINRLSFTRTSTGLNINAPASGNLCPPGHYMLFILNGNGVPSVAKVVQVGAQAINAPTNLTATAVSASQVALAWTDNAANEAGFRVERSTNGTNFSEVATVGPNVTSYTDGGLAGFTTYYYRVRAYNATAVSGYSNTASARTKKR